MQAVGVAGNVMEHIAVALGDRLGLTGRPRGVEQIGAPLGAAQRKLLAPCSGLQLCQSQNRDPCSAQLLSQRRVGLIANDRQSLGILDDACQPR